MGVQYLVHTERLTEGHGHGDLGQVYVQYLEHTERLIQGHRHGDLG